MEKVVSFLKYNKEEDRMKLSARNVLNGKVKNVETGPISSVVTLEIAPGIEIDASITTESVRELKLEKGQDAFAMIKASNVMIGVEE
jgi:molybdopterin-binding protein